MPPKSNTTMPSKKRSTQRKVEAAAESFTMLQKATTMPPKKRLKVEAAAESFTMLQKTKNDIIKQYISVKKTDDSYDGHLRRGMKFLADVVAKRREAGIIICEEGIDTDELAKAFDAPAPNKYSAIALERFLTHKCFVENLQESVAWGIQSAFCRYWDTM
jgi:hypothetical protein